jgi:hypothetical protein
MVAAELLIMDKFYVVDVTQKNIKLLIMNRKDPTKDVKLKIVYRDFNGDAQIESVWAEKMDTNYKIANIPFFAYNISYEDIVSAEEEDGELYFEELIIPSGNSTIQMIIYNKTHDNIAGIGKELVDLGCGWEGSHLEGYISINVPATIDYKIIKSYLDEGFIAEKWDYKEACLAHKN